MAASSRRSSISPPTGRWWRRPGAACRRSTCASISMPPPCPATSPPRARWSASAVSSRPPRRRSSMARASSSPAAAAPISRRRPRAEAMAFANAGDLVRRDRDLAKTALVDLGGETSPREFSFAALDAMANGVARALARRGLGRGERVAILAANRAEYLASVYGIMRAGLVAVPVNFKFPRATIDFILADSGARLVLCDGPRHADCPAGLPVVTFGDSGADSFGGFLD